jgi:protein gp37
MAEQTGIQWCDSTMNPWIGCTRVGPGCDFCYAAAHMDTRLGKVKWGAGEQRERTSAAYWKQPERWNAQPFFECTKCGWRGSEKEMEKHPCGCGRGAMVKARRRVFCASLADVFDNEVPDSWRHDLFALIGNTPNLDWLLVTKRIGNAKDMLPWGKILTGDLPPWPNVWLGATVVNQQEANRDIPKLLDTPAALRFLSMEPLLGPVDLSPFLAPVCCGNPVADYGGEYMGQREVVPSCCGNPNPSPLSWVIVGGESGPKARPFDLAWCAQIVRDCQTAGVPVHVKQLGDNPCRTDGSAIEVHDYGHKGKDMHRWPELLRVRQHPGVR